MKNIFTYGTLMFPDVIHSIVHKKYLGETVFIKGFKRTQIIGDVYPVVQRDQNACLEGVLYRGVSSQDCRRLDIFEGDYYERCKTIAYSECEGRTTKVLCELYVLKAQYRKLASKKSWDPQQFSSNFLQSFTSRYPPR